MSTGVELVPLGTVQLARLLEVEPRAFLQRGQGRETFEAELDGVVRIVKRTSEVARLWATPSTAAREARALAALRAAGIEVPAVLGWMEERFAPLAARRSVLVLERIAHDEDLKQLVARSLPAERRPWLARAVELLATLHRLGWHHRDYYAQHLLVRDGRLVLIDLGRARHARRTAERWRIKDLAALLSSLRDWLTRAEQLRVVAHYLDARGVQDPAARSRWCALALAKGARMAAHVSVDQKEPR